MFQVEYQSTNGPFEGLNPRLGVTLKQLIVNRNQNDDKLGDKVVSFGVIKGSVSYIQAKKMSLGDYQQLRSRSPFPINRQRS